jgi:hypothetical protein
MILPLVGRLSMKSLVAGGVLATVGVSVARQLIVSVMRVGFEATEGVREAWHTAKIEGEKMSAEARSYRRNDEVDALRAEVAGLKAQLAKK